MHKMIAVRFKEVKKGMREVFVHQVFTKVWKPDEANNVLVLPLLALSTTVLRLQWMSNSTVVDVDLYIFLRLLSVRKS
jgi:hypothetical protein